MDRNTLNRLDAAIAALTMASDDLTCTCCEDNNYDDTFCPYCNAEFTIENLKKKRKESAKVSSTLRR